MDERRTQVLIVGGGLVGLSTSLFLSWHGVDNVLVERRGRTSVHPRAWGWYPRTLELLRGAGIEREVLEESAGFVGHTLNGRVESLCGRELAVTTIPAAEDVSDVSPIGRIVSLSQDRLEPIMLRRAVDLGADVRFGCALAELTVVDDGVRAVVEDVGSGTRSLVRARYAVAADGAHSAVRAQLGIAQRGRGTLRHQMSILFRADLEGPLRGRRFAICQVDNPNVDGILGHDDSLHNGTLIVTFHPERGESPGDFTDDRCLRLVRAAVGDPALDVSIRSVLPWEMAALTAERFAAGPVFLAGDAAHVIPPVGGYGANTGIQDAHNLAWKLAAVLCGTAGPELLDTYEAERLPVARTTTEQAGLRLAVRGGFATDEQRAAMADTLAVTSGYAYRSDSISPDDGAGPSGADAPPELAHPRDLTGRPGTRAPHVAVRRGGPLISVLDLFGTHPVLITGPQGERWATAGRAASARTGVPLDVHAVGTDLVETGRHWHTAYGVGPAGATLVRPDGFVCWRSTGPAPEPAASGAAVLVRALERMMRHPPAAA